MKTLADYIIANLGVVLTALSMNGIASTLDPTTRTLAATVAGLGGAVLLGLIFSAMATEWHWQQGSIYAGVAVVSAISQNIIRFILRIGGFLDRNSDEIAAAIWNHVKTKWLGHDK